MPELPRGTVTFLFTDIEGSTWLWQEHHEAMESVYVRHDTILREAFSAYGGVVYKVVGDALQVAFPTAPQAVSAALVAQRALQAEDWSVHGLPEPVRVRMALHMGAVDPDPDGDYRSPVLNRLGRLLGAGHGGQVLLSQATQELSRDDLPPDTTLRDLGDRRLKDLYRPERVYQLTGTGLASEFPPLRTLDARPNNLPVQPTPYIGREAAVAEVRALLMHTEVRLVTLTGPGGMGKTRLALQVAADLLDRFHDGVWVVELQAVTDPALVPSAMASTLGVEEIGDQSLVASLMAHLGDKELLLVLDNFEQVVEAAPLLGKLLAGCSKLTVLVTSRIRLGLRSEREHPVPPLSLPDLRRLPSAAALSQYEAVRLFIERAQSVRPTFDVTNENAPAVAEICVRLDGLPLAIELAAARVRMLPPEAMLRRLEQRLPLLTGGARDLPARQQTLRGAITWSYDLLTPDEQTLFRRLSVFAGGFSIEAAEAVAATDELGLDVFEGLERLVDHSLLRQTETEGEPRFAMLETIREYGLEQLERQGDAEEIRHQHAAFFRLLAEEDRELTGDHAALIRWQNGLQRESDNLRGALGWALTRQDATTSFVLVTRFTVLCLRGGRMSEARAWLERAVALDHGVPSLERGRALVTVGDIARHQGDLERGRAWVEEGMGVFRVLDDDRGVYHALLVLASIVFDQGDAEGAIRFGEDALDIAINMESKGMQANTLAFLGFAATASDNLERASVVLQRAMVIFHELGGSAEVAQCLVGLAGVDRKRGDLRSAMTQLEEAVTLLSVGENQQSHHIDAIRGNAAKDLAEVALEQGDHHRAVTAYRESLASAGESGHVWVIAYCLEGLAAVAVWAKRPHQAAWLLGAAEALREAKGVQLRETDRTHHEQLINSVCTELDQEVLHAAWSAGRSMPLEEVIAEVLAMTAEPA